ncbi:hypothetical protein BGZ98_001594, partial [Dissophora globulifera]
MGQKESSENSEKSSGRTTLRNDNEVMKEIAQAKIDADGVMGALTITHEGPLQMVAEIDVMEIDDEDIRPTPPIDMDQVSINDASEHLKATSSRFRRATRRNLGVYQRNRRAVYGGTIAVKQQYVDIYSEVEDIEVEMEIWKSFVSSRESTDDASQDAELKNVKAPRQEPAPKKQNITGLSRRPQYSTSSLVTEVRWATNDQVLAKNVDKSAVDTERIRLNFVTNAYLSQSTSVPHPSTSKYGMNNHATAVMDENNGTNNRG